MIGAKKAPSDLCWICGTNKADSGEHKTKRSDLAAVLGGASEESPLYFHDLERHNKPIKSLDAKILKAPIRICQECNSARTQPHDRAWEKMSADLRGRDLVVGRWVRANRIFHYDTKQQMIDVQLFFLKLFGCMIAEAKANGFDVPMDLASFSEAIMSGRPHPEVHLQFGKGDGTVGRSNLHCWKTDKGCVGGGWLYQLGSIAVSVLFVQTGCWERRDDIWHPHSHTSSKRFLVADFNYADKKSNETNS